MVPQINKTTVLKEIWAFTNEPKLLSLLLFFFFWWKICHLREDLSPCRCIQCACQFPYLAWSSWNDSVTDICHHLLLINLITAPFFFLPETGFCVTWPSVYVYSWFCAHNSPKQRATKPKVMSALQNKKDTRGPWTQKRGFGSTLLQRLGWQSEDWANCGECKSLAAPASPIRCQHYSACVCSDLCIPPLFYLSSLSVSSGAFGGNGPAITAKKSPIESFPPQIQRAKHLKSYLASNSKICIWMCTINQFIPKSQVLNTNINLYLNLTLRLRAKH